MSFRTGVAGEEPFGRLRAGSGQALLFASSASAASEKQVPLRLRRFGMTMLFFGTSLMLQAHLLQQHIKARIATQRIHQRLHSQIQ